MDTLAASATSFEALYRQREARSAELFAAAPLMARFRAQFDARMYRPVEALLDALLASYREWGGTASPPLMAIVDWREVPTYSEFEIIRDAFSEAGAPTVIADPRDLEYRRASGLFANGQYSGAQYGVPWSVTPLGLYANLDVMKKAGESGKLGPVGDLGSSIVDMQQHVDGLQKNLETLKKVKSALGG